MKFKCFFLVACYATLQRRSVCRSVCRSVTLYFFWGFLRFSASLLLPKWSSDVKYGPCPPARDWGSRVPGLVKKYIKSMTILKSFKKIFHLSHWTKFQLESFRSYVNLKKKLSNWNLPDMAFFTNLNSWIKSLYLITISKLIDLKEYAWRHFVDNELYFQFPLNFS